MMKRCAALTVALWAIAATTVAQPWIPVECSKRHEENWRRFAAAIRRADPGSPIYVPKPFPANHAEVIEDFEHGYISVMRKGDQLQDVPVEERPLFTGIQNRTLRYEIRRVENWSPTRCLPEQQDDHNFVLDIYDRGTGKKIARGSVNHSGFLASWQMATLANGEINFIERGVRSLEEALAKARSTFGVKGRDAQWVMVWGSYRCTDVTPCPAFRSQGKTYLLFDQDLFEFEASSPAYSRSKATGLHNWARIRREHDYEKERVISVGADHWVVARRVPPLQ